jgi:sugar phosphate isomerase/epimerase
MTLRSESGGESGPAGYLSAEGGPPLARRSFLGALGTTLGALMLPSGCSRGPAGERAAGAALDRIGIQLYTVRELMRQDVERTLAALADIGYREVEFAGLHGLTAKAMRTVLDRNGLSAPSSHVSLQEIRGQWARTLDDATALGQRYIVCPWIDEAERSVDGYRRVAAQFNATGEAAKGAGLQFAYHNHAYEFAPVGGVVPYDLLLAECDPQLVQMELDLFWIVKGGRDPLAYFARHPGRFPLVHVKDMARDGSMVDVGRGTIDFAGIFARAQQAGIRHYFVEHDEPPSPLADARASYDYLRQLKIRSGGRGR